MVLVVSGHEKCELSQLSADYTSEDLYSQCQNDWAGDTSAVNSPHCGSTFFPLPELQVDGYNTVILYLVSEVFSWRKSTIRGSVRMFHRPIPLLNSRFITESIRPVHSRVLRKRSFASRPPMDRQHVSSSIPMSGRWQAR